jgi:hypothetical protein
MMAEHHQDTETPVDGHERSGYGGVRSVERTHEMSEWESIFLEIQEHLPDLVFREVADYDLCAKVMACGTTYFYPSSPGALCIYTDTESGEFEGEEYGLIFEEYVASKVRTMPLTDLGQLTMFVGFESKIIHQAALERLARGRLLNVLRSGRRARWPGAWGMSEPCRWSRHRNFVRLMPRLPRALGNDLDFLDALDEMLR